MRQAPQNDWNVVPNEHYQFASFYATVGFI